MNLLRTNAAGSRIPAQSDAVPDLHGFAHGFAVVALIGECYGARWKIEPGFHETKREIREIGSAHNQTRNPDAVTNHLHFCVAATTAIWICGAHRVKAPARRYKTRKRTDYAFGELRRVLSGDLAGRDLGTD